MLTNTHDSVRYALDAISITATIATVAGWLPPIAALMSIIWLSIQIYDRLKRGPRK